MNIPVPDIPEVRVVGLPQPTTGFDLVERLDLAMRLKVYGPLEPMTGERLAELAETISLRGRGGAGFPFGRKLRAVAKTSIRRGVRPVALINGSEGEPACRKDTVLLNRNRAPHLMRWPRTTPWCPGSPLAGRGRRRAGSWSGPADRARELPARRVPAGG